MGSIDNRYPSPPVFTFFIKQRTVETQCIASLPTIALLGWTEVRSYHTYNLSRDAIVERVKHIIGLPNITTENVEHFAQAFA